MNSSYILLLIYILDGMILKRNKFVMQWRKFEFKGVIFLKKWIFEFLGLFLDFSRILYVLFPYLNCKKRRLISARPAEMTWHAGPARMRHDTHGHVAEPREPTRHLGGVEETRTRGRGHASPRGRPGGSMWQCKGLQVKGPWVSGP